MDRTAALESGRLLITGPSGSGKSYFASALAAMGYPAYDSDTVSGLASWHDQSGRPVEPPGQLDPDFLRGHRYLWDEGVLESFLTSRRVALLFGISHNSQQLTSLFDRVFLLKLPVGRILRNLQSDSRTNAFGKTPEHQAMARDDTTSYYLAAPTEWTRVTPLTPAPLIHAVEQVLTRPIPTIGHR